MKVAKFILENWEWLSLIAVILIQHLRKKWLSEDTAAALLAVVASIEQARDTRIKEIVQAREALLDDGARKQLQKAVATVDPKKETPDDMRKIAERVGVLEE